MENNKKILITGVAGQLGSYAAEYLLDYTNFDVVGTIRRSGSPNHKNIAELYKHKGRFRVEICDVTDKASITNLIKKESPDYFMNFAGNSFLGNSWDAPYSHFEVNFLSVLHQLEAIKEFVPHCRYLTCGSSEIFGFTENDRQHELCRPNPRNPYGVSKSASLELVRAYRGQYGLFAVNAILYNAESKRRSKDFLSRKVAEGVVAIKKAIKEKRAFAPIEVGNLESLRDWSHASDFVDGCWKMLFADKPQDYVLSSETCHSVRQFIEKAFEVAGIEGRWQMWFNKEDETFESGVGTLVRTSKKFYRPSESFILRGDSTKAREELNWHPKYNFERLVSEIVEDANR